eukprot:COSAG01_NODE_64846_length_275_cov_0.585227_1_plen_24_part_10
MLFHLDDECSSSVIVGDSSSRPVD